MQMKNVELLVFLAMRKYSLPMLLPLMEGNFTTANYLEAAIPLTIIFWYYSKMNGNLQPLVINPDDITFRAVIRKTICCLRRIFDNLMQSSFSRDPIISWETSGTKNYYLFEKNSFNNYI